VGGACVNKCMSGATGTYSRRAVALLIFAVFTLKLLLLLPQVYVYNLHSPQPQPWGLLLAKLIFGTYSWAALTPLILVVSRRWQVERRNLPRRLLIHFGLGLLFAAAQTLVYHGGLALLPTDLRAEAFHEVPRLAGPWSFVFNGILAYASILAVHQAILYFRKYQEREFRLQQAQLQILRMQLHPHFLFNTLNTVAQLIHEDQAAAEKMVISLSDMLRISLYQMNEQEVTLRQELGFVGKYLEIMEARFEGRLSVRLDIDPRALEAYVPTMLLQPLVENSIRHGFDPRRGGGRVEISARRDDRTLRLSVADNGCGIERGAGPHAPDAGHIGLANTRARLDYLYGPEHGFELRSLPGSGVMVSVSLPFRESRAASPRPPESHGSPR
jgi:two-component system LytT family sensor kinase